MKKEILFKHTRVLYYLNFKKNKYKYFIKKNIQKRERYNKRRRRQKKEKIEYIIKCSEFLFLLTNIERLALWVIKSIVSLNSH